MQLSATQIADYREQGFLRIPGVFGADVIAALEQEAGVLYQRKDLVSTENIRCRWADHVETKECRFDCFDPVTDIGPVSKAVALDPRLLALLEQLYGEPACLLKDKLIYKPPFAPGYDLHQDYIGWSDFPRSFMTVIVAIDPSTAHSGATEVFAGYHQQGSLVPEDGEFHRLDISLIDASRGVHLELQPGDIACFNGFVPHRSQPNRSDRWRRLLYLSYNQQSDGGDQRESHYAQFRAWLMDKYVQYGRSKVYFR